jgi:hypothetical protein
MSTSNPRWNRRQFLRQLALLAFGPAVAGLSGCGTQTTPRPMPSNKFPTRPGKQPSKPPGS